MSIQYCKKTDQLPFTTSDILLHDKSILHQCTETDVFTCASIEPGHFERKVAQLDLTVQRQWYVAVLLDPAEDLALKDLIPEKNHFGKLNEIRGYIIIGYPNNEDQLNALKQFNIPIDKLTILSDNTQEAPNKTLSKRLNDAELEQVAQFFTGIGPVKEALG